MEDRLSDKQRHFLDTDAAEGDSFILDLAGDTAGAALEPAPSGAALGAATLATLRDLPFMVAALSEQPAPQFIFWNHECERVTGYSTSEMTEQPGALARLYPDADYLARKRSEPAWKAGYFRDFEWTLTTRGGERRRIAWTTVHGLCLRPGRQELWMVGTDVTARAESDRLVRSRDRLLRGVFRYLPDMVSLLDGAGRWQLSNPAAHAMLGLSEKEVYGQTAVELARRSPSAAEGLRLSALNEEATWQSGRPTQLEEVAEDGVGGSRYFDVLRVPTFSRSGHRLHMLVVRRDVTDQRHAAVKLELAGKVLDLGTNGVVITDAARRVVMVNSAYTDITGVTAAQAVGLPPALFADSQHDRSFQESVWQAVDASGNWSGEVSNRRRSGEVFPQWLKLSVLRHRTNGTVTHYVAALSDLSSSKAAEEKIAVLSTQDAVTGLLNRTQAGEFAERALARAREENREVTLVVVDVDNFKALNDSLGHAAGDELLRHIGSCLQRSAGARATIGRLSGDEFLVVLPGVAGTNDAAQAVRALMDAAVQPVELGGLPVNVSISAGVAMFPADGDAFDTLFGRADAALHTAKREGRNSYHFASADMNAAALERFQLEMSLRRAVDGDALRLEYQPLIELATRRVVGVEALCRWDDPERGAVPPAIFIPVAEECGLIDALGGWVLRTATRQLAAWHEAGHPELMVAVNLSARQFRRGTLLQQVEDALVESGIPPGKLELELTESALLHEGETATATLRRLKALGVKLSIDDFGTGYSSFAYLRRFKFDKIKIDQSFVRDLIDDPDNAAIVRGIISLARSLGLEVLAEGVESEPIALRLKHLQCGLAQGYHFARPLRPEALAQFL
ncbi:bifunctional diguanylate cyclase/phosphodiesterase [Xylophilus sp.]|uniref:bifunctional diguanylate cyclase/phosphodiesterase n=1 Tax=Xylophilus sp. TaxID=2653893 RepID=UPI0013BD28FD|nr:bifunctional diguanylate cyclase/phosphodiesterase [Xylophilus sp.]KAF1045274.1 MAG: putative signaling protein [Xylophilus sp.]